MKKLILLSVISLMTIFSSEGQKSGFSIKAGIINCKTKTMQVPSARFNIAGFDPRIGGIFGGRYNYRFSRYFNTGVDLLYLLKGNTSKPSDVETIYSNHYLSLSPFISVFPFVNSESKYISCISPEISFDFNYFLGTDKYNVPNDETSFYKYELAYSLKLTYQPNKFGIQFFHSRSLSPFYRTHINTPLMDDYKYSFVSGVSILYKVFPVAKSLRTDSK